MITLRQIERLFNDQQFRRLYHELITGRPEAAACLVAELARPVPLAALGAIRLDELSQSHSPLYRRFLNVIATAQQSDGSWGDPLVTAFCVRALLTTSTAGDQAARGLMHLASLQKTESVWPREPIRRMPADALTSAFILLQLGDRDAFRAAVRFDDAIEWFESNAPVLEPVATSLWLHAQTRCRLTPQNSRRDTLWSTAA